MDITRFREQTLRCVREISDYMSNLILPAAEVPGLTLTGIRLLIELETAPSGTHTVGSLGKHLRMAGSNASSLCKSLEKKGLITRRRSSLDERMVHILLTQEGCAVLRRLEQDMNERFRPVLEDEAPEDINAILDGMDKLCGLLKKMQAQGKEETD